MKRLAGMIVWFFCLTGACCAFAEQAGGDWKDLYIIQVESAIEYGDLQAEWALEPSVYVPAPQDARIALNPADAELSGDIRLVEHFEAYDALYPLNQGGWDTVLSSGDSENTALWHITVDQPGLYELLVSYLALGGNEIKVQRKITIDGETPFEEANNLCFYRVFEEEVQENGKMRINAIGDEVWPHMYEKEVWQTVRAVDQQAIYVDPLQFYLSAGEHEIALHYVDQPVVLGEIAFAAPKSYPAYEEKLAEWQAAGCQAVSKDTVIKVQAENSAWRSENVIRRESDADPMTEPKSGAERVLNIVGGYRWRLGNAAVSWNVDVPESGLYAIHFKVLQSTDPGMPSYRQIMIDGEIPFEEMKLYSFPYDSHWYGDTLRDENGTPYQFYLEKGTHTLTATVKLGPIGDIMRRTEKDTTYLGQVQREIVKITGSEPDYNYEYDLYRTMPELSGQLTYLAGRLQESAELLASISSETTSMENNFRQIIDQLHFFAEDVDRIPKALSDLDNAQSNMGTYISTIEKCPMAMDYLALTSPEEAFEITTSNFLQRMAVTGENFMASFTKDYDSVGLIVDDGTTSEEITVLNVWIARGTEWGEILKELADEDFTPRTGIVINLHVLPTGQLSTGSVNTIMLSVASGTAPDVALSVEYNLPNEFAFRGAVADLSQFPDFEEVTKNFYPSSLVPFQYNGGVYALPETMDFTCMIYRRDVLAELGVELPETWEDLYQKVLPRLYENNMSFSLPVDTSVSSNSPGALRGFTMLLLQTGGDYYHNNGASSALDTPEAYKAFKAWTDMYANYEIDAESNFFTRIRTGTMPVGIGNFTTYMQLMTSAPELYGRWSIAPVP
ncbi:MAG: extracellular solute-binding protein, partial [Clostridia bacterium]|nr:extracellular solute-binding protein [Clostridia bacterium]